MLILTFMQRIKKIIEPGLQLNLPLFIISAVYLGITQLYDFEHQNSY